MKQRLCSQAAILVLEPAPSDEVNSLHNWLDGNKPTMEEESHFLSDEEDLCTLSRGYKDKDALRRFIERRWANVFVTEARAIALIPSVAFLCMGHETG
jgi:hypothetical protein